MLPLEPTDDLAKPAFTDTATCRKWLSQLQLTNLNLAHGTLRSQLNEFNRYPMRGKERLHTLETLRETISTVQADYTKKLFGKRLPLVDDEYALLVALSNLWQGMSNGYLRCLQSLDAGDSSLGSEAALLCHHGLLYSSLQLDEFLRAGYEPPPEMWQRLHALYAYIEEKGLQRVAVTDKSRRTGHAVSCCTLYARILLLHRARLLGLTRGQWQIIERWLEQWGEAFAIEPRCSMSKEDAQPLAVDLAGQRGLVPITRATSAASMRFLPMVPLSKLIRVKTILLQQGQSPRQLDLGDDLDSRACDTLLRSLHNCWCERRAESIMDEPRDVPVAQVCNGLESIYAHIARKPFRQVTALDVTHKEAQKQIEVFGRVLDQTDRHNLTELGFLVDEWFVEEDGLLNGRLLRKTTSSVRLGANQVICVRMPDAMTYKVGVTALASVARNGQLYVAVRYLPGSPRAVIARGDATGNLASGAAAALLLPEIANLRIPASLILPRDWFQAGRVLELALPDQKKQNVTLGISVERGNDYERVSFSFKN